MNCHFEYKTYARPFRSPLVTAHGVWRRRRGIIIRLEDGDGRFGFGEIAPMPPFGTETMRASLQWCENRPPVLDTDRPVSETLPCCQVAVQAALGQMLGEVSRHTFPVATLISGRADLEQKQNLGFLTFKVKVGVSDREREFDRIDRLTGALQNTQHLRLDANGGLNEGGLVRWLDFLEGKPVDYFEQPLPKGRESGILQVSRGYGTPIALDESVARSRDLLVWSDWPGPLVIKPTILGHFKGVLPPEAVGSSVFETSFGYEAALQFLARHQTSEKPIGFSTDEFFREDGWFIHERGPRVTAGEVTPEDLQALWESRK